MGNRAVIIPLAATIIAFAAMALSPVHAHADSRHSLAQSIIKKVNERLCERQEKLSGRISIRLINPSKCETSDPVPTVTLTANPTTIDEGESSTLSWVSHNATHCEASLGWSGAKNTSGSQTVSPDETTVYHIDCTGPGGVGGDDVTVTVEEDEPDAPTVEITADPTTITAGSSSTLEWESTNADSCTASNGWGGSKAIDGSQSVTPSVTTTYTITCAGDGGSASDSVTVSVNQSEEETATLTLVKVVVNDDSGEAEADDWTLVADGPSDISGTSGSSAVTDAVVEVGTYNLSETGGPGGYTASIYSCQKNDGPDVLGNSITLADGDEATCTITNNDNEDEEDAPTVNLVASPTTVHERSAGSATTTLTWTTSNASSCTASGGSFTGSKATSSTQIVTPTATTTYTLECTGPGGTENDSVTVNFVPEDEPEQEGTLVISEVLYNPSVAQGSENGNEWVEIFNGTNGTLNLSGYFLRDNSASEIFVLPQGTTLASGASLLVTGASSTNPTSGHWSVPGNASWLTFSGFSNQLANTNDFVELFNTASSSVDAVCWGANDEAFDCDTLVTGDGESLGRIDRMIDTGTAADWQIQTPNPGQ